MRGFLLAFIEENPDKIDQSSMNSYRTLFKSLITFDKNDVSLSNLNVDYVNRFYDFLEKAGYKSNTIQTRFKKLKKLVNTAITRGLMTEYPFGKGKTYDTFIQG
ncbi:MAG: phage integrase SAM-like domain-containing protein [Saprospiraceae bacterium]|nr:phage integrase SAM-like domain-containing protein [Saprospiraceae bacterium]